ncbi:MAG TPA: carboxypeptidase-like regulatory domain-containing protein, partial [Edaphobacter sp.]|nr:carboxypeptidase-like regulatory domain-containing protein [Edaphobacter sp.]
MSRAVAGVLVIFGVLVFMGPAAMAQTGFSGLRGNITDASGGVLPGVQVVLTQPDTGTEVRTAVSDQQGNFEFPNLIPGTYQVKSEMKGYKAFIAEGVVLDAGQIRRLDIRLAVGSEQQTVEVHAGVALINTEGGSISGQFDKAKVADTPVIDSYPSPYALIATLPGVQGNGFDLKISGQDTSQQSFQADGVSNDRAGEQSNSSKFFDEATVVTVNAPADSS